MHGNLISAVHRAVPGGHAVAVIDEPIMLSRYTICRRRQMMMARYVTTGVIPAACWQRLLANGQHAAGLLIIGSMLEK